MKTSILIFQSLFCKLFIVSVHSVRVPSLNVFHFTVIPSKDKDCADGVCNIDSKPIVDLEKKVIDEWASASGSQVPPTSSDSAEVPRVITQSVLHEEVVLTNDNHVTLNETSSTANNSRLETIITADEAPDFINKVEQLAQLGWNKDDATRALNLCDMDLEKSITLLETEEELKETINANIAKLQELGWKKDASENALEQQNQNVTAAIELLEAEEAEMSKNFEDAVADMIASGWNEFVARQALMTQWAIDQRKNAGHNTTVSDEVLKSIKPTFKKRAEDEKAEIDESAKAVKAKLPSTKSGSGVKNDSEKITPAKKEDCVFEVTSDTFQKLVVESPVPVLIDVYADWCGPCKQLGPVLEQAAINSGGIYRLAKVNSDNERSIAQVLDVSSLPSVFAVKNGKITDRFLGMLPSDQIQQFLVRAVTGYGDRVQTDMSDEQLKQLTDKMTNMAGLASLTFKKKELFQTLISQALSEVDAWTEDGTVLSQSVQTVLAYISNAAKDIMNFKFRKIATDSNTYKEKVGDSASAIKLLEVAGFKKSDDGIEWNLSHKNAALLNFLLQKTTELTRAKNTSTKSAAEINMGDKKSLRSKSPTTHETKSAASAKNTPTRSITSISNSNTAPMTSTPASTKTKYITFSLRTSNGLAASLQIKPDQLESYTELRLIDLIQKLIEHPVNNLGTGEQKQSTNVAAYLNEKKATWTSVEIRHPPPRKTIAQGAKELTRTVGELASNADSNISGLSLYLQLSETSVTGKADNKAKSLGKGWFAKKSSNSNVDAKATGQNKSPKAAGTGKTHTLLSSGLLDQKQSKGNEYFGGDSTVVQAVDDSDDDDDEDEVDEISDEDGSEFDSDDVNEEDNQDSDQIFDENDD